MDIQSQGGRVRWSVTDSPSALKRYGAKIQNAEFGSSQFKPKYDNNGKLEGYYDNLNQQYVSVKEKEKREGTASKTETINLQSTPSRFVVSEGGYTDLQTGQSISAQEKQRRETQASSPFRIKETPFNLPNQITTREKIVARPTQPQQSISTQGTIGPAKDFTFRQSYDTYFYEMAIGKDLPKKIGEEVYLFGLSLYNYPIVKGVQWATGPLRSRLSRKQEIARGEDISKQITQSKLKLKSLETSTTPFADLRKLQGEGFVISQGETVLSPFNLRREEQSQRAKEMRANAFTTLIEKGKSKGLITTDTEGKLLVSDEKLFNILQTRGSELEKNYGQYSFDISPPPIKEPPSILSPTEKVVLWSTTPENIPLVVWGAEAGLYYGPKIIQRLALKKPKEIEANPLLEEEALKTSRSRVTFIPTVKETGEVIMGIEKSGKISFIGGGIKGEESARSALGREVGEELGIDITKFEDINYKGKVVNPETTHYIFYGRLAQKNVGQIKAGSDITAITFRKPEDLLKLKGRTFETPITSGGIRSYDIDIFKLMATGKKPSWLVTESSTFGKFKFTDYFYNPLHKEIKYLSRSKSTGRFEKFGELIFLGEHSRYGISLKRQLSALKGSEGKELLYTHGTPSGWKTFMSDYTTRTLKVSGEKTQRGEAGLYVHPPTSTKSQLGYGGVYYLQMEAGSYELGSKFVWFKRPAFYTFKKVSDFFSLTKKTIDGTEFERIIKPNTVAKTIKGKQSIWLGKWYQGGGAVDIQPFDIVTAPKATARRVGGLLDEFYNPETSLGRKRKISNVLKRETGIEYGEYRQIEYYPSITRGYFPFTSYSQKIYSEKYVYNEPYKYATGGYLAPKLQYKAPSYSNKPYGLMPKSYGYGYKQPSYNFGQAYGETPKGFYPPPPTLFGGGSSFKFGEKGRRLLQLGKRKYKYAPSLYATVTNRRGRMPTQKIFTGLEIRPVVR
jgi:hypothetical protein